MAFDAGMLACVIHEINSVAEGARIEKIYQPEKDTVILQMRSFLGGKRLLINAGANNPRIGFSETAMEKACNALINAKEILLFGLGNSASVALDAAHKFFRLGLRAHAYTDNHMQAIAAAHTHQDCVAIGFSHSGSSKDIVQALELAKANGATTIAITNYGKSPLVKVSDVVLNTVSDETNYSILGLKSRIAALAIVDAIYSWLVCHLLDANEQINETESALQKKKY